MQDIIEYINKKQKEFLMKISGKLQKLVAQGLISEEQAEKIMTSEQASHSKLAWKLMYWIAGLFIGLGFILIIGSNWSAIPAPVKLLGDFGIWAGILYGTYWSITNRKNKIKELFLTLSFLFVAATIGLIAQIFNLSGGWQSFATTWAMLSFVFVVFSRLIVLNLVWLWLFFSIINLEFLFHFLEPLLMKGPITALITGTILCALLSYAGGQLYKAINKLIVMPKAFAIYFLIGMYSIALFGGAMLGMNHSRFFGHSPFLANVFVFVFLGIRLLLAVHNKNIKSFIRNTHLVELFILFLFVTRYGNLFMSGVGFIVGGILLLGVLYLLKRTSKYIKTLEVFHE